MSEMQPEATPDSGNVFTRKVGPLPMWAWMGLVLLVAVFYYLYKKNKASSTSSTNPTTSAASTAANTPGGVDASLVPQFVNQVYNQETPPAAPNVTETNSNNTNSTVGNSNVTQAAPTNTNPAYGQSGPPNTNYQAITSQQASTFLSNKDVYNPAKQQSQRPFIWNGSSYVPATVINPNYTYYAGPLETKELATYTKAHP